MFPYLVISIYFGATDRKEFIDLGLAQKYVEQQKELHSNDDRFLCEMFYHNHIMYHYYRYGTTIDEITVDKP